MIFKVSYILKFATFWLNGLKINIKRQNEGQKEEDTQKYACMVIFIRCIGLHFDSGLYISMHVPYYEAHYMPSVDLAIIWCMTFESFNHDSIDLLLCQYASTNIKGFLITWNSWNV